MELRSGARIGLGLGKHSPLGERVNNRALDVMARTLKDLQTQSQFPQEIVTVSSGWNRRLRDGPAVLQ